MDGVIRILRRFIGSTLFMFAMLLIINFALLGTLIFNETKEERSPAAVAQQVAEAVDRQAGKAGYQLGGNEERLLEQHKAWAMLINGGGSVTWSYRLPDEIPLSYSLQEIAKLSRHYLLDYPVYSWEHADDGLVVVGYPQSSYAKYQYNFSISWIRTLPLRLALLLLGNMVLALLLSIFIGTRMIRSIRPLVNGIHALAKEEPVHVEPKGILSDLAKSINSTSDKLQSKNTALKARDEARSNWIAGISHDIRTPLSMVLGYASELEEHEEVPAQQRLHAGIIRKQGEQLRSLVSDLNLVSMLEYEMQPLHLKTVRLSAVARLTVSELINNGLDERYPITLHISDESIQVQADEKLLLRGIANLVHNSIRHNPQGCEIKIETSQPLELESSISLCRLVVTDTGRGIRKEALSDLLELPYASGRQRAAANGHGLGLPMVARIAKAHHGRLLLNSESGKGLEAVLELPC
ncbi:HAMP domain-containing histidine kinase [Paenibacillus alba]|uniref:sensor histidine kinase n=1 Tax=Paenibacillus alba TaxID=1197127 RepID=UPI0015641FC6|nr:HAMP domain-containing sensor histidine kinase [Paenibacillus alba]NQX70671.1 HAMP domain-containing histidine kinase [Paenibacillus alba]